MKTSIIRRTGEALLGSALLGALVLTPAAAGATPVGAETSAAGCEVTGGTMNWGMKESFRSYISGSIANGSWEASDGAEYETPEFIWSEATGTIDPEAGIGVVSFVGTVHFTGHDGVLDLTLANPTVEFEGDGKAALLLDVQSTDMEGDEAVDAEQEWAGEITVDEDIAPDGAELVLSEMPVTLTESGAEAFAGFYEADTELDPLTVSLTFDGCESAAEEPVAPEASQPEPAAPAEARVPWLPIGVGAAALFVTGLTLGILIGGRGKNKLVQGQGAHAASGEMPEP